MCNVIPHRHVKNISPSNKKSISNFVKCDIQASAIIQNIRNKWRHVQVLCMSQNYQQTVNVNYQKVFVPSKMSKIHTFWKSWKYKLLAPNIVWLFWCTCKVVFKFYNRENARFRHNLGALCVFTWKKKKKWRKTIL